MKAFILNLLKITKLLFRFSCFSKTFVFSTEQWYFSIPKGYT